MEPGISYKCSQTDCSVATLGKCVNQLSLDACPNVIKVTQEADPQIVVDKPKRTSEPNIKWGDSFSEADLTQITYRFPSNLIALVGEPYSGKSTLYAALFDSFHSGGCGEYYFHSTRTPIAFERICHLSREKCKGREPLTERTKSYEFLYLHLSVKHKSLQNEPQHLIFADVNGERYQEARNNEDTAKDITILRRAEHIFFIADGGLLIKDQHRHAVKKDVFNMIGRCIQSNLIKPDKKINLIVTKWDLIVSNGKVEDIKSFFIDPITEKYSGNLAKIIKVASRSMNDDVPSRSGIDEFLDECLIRPSINKKAFVPDLVREYQKIKFQQ